MEKKKRPFYTRESTAQLMALDCKSLLVTYHNATHFSHGLEQNKVQANNYEKQHIVENLLGGTYTLL